jgi:hypothetical protein
MSEITRITGAHTAFALMYSKMPNIKPKIVKAFGVIRILAKDFETGKEMVSQPLTIPEIFASPCNLLQVKKNSSFVIT